MHRSRPISNTPRKLLDTVAKPKNTSPKSTHSTNKAEPVVTNLKSLCSATLPKTQAFQSKGQSFIPTHTHSPTITEKLQSYGLSNEHAGSQVLQLKDADLDSESSTDRVELPASASNAHSKYGTKETENKPKKIEILKPYLSLTNSTDTTKSNQSSQFLLLDDFQPGQSNESDTDTILDTDSEYESDTDTILGTDSDSRSTRSEGNISQASEKPRNTSGHLIRSAPTQKITNEVIIKSYEDLLNKSGAKYRELVLNIANDIIDNANLNNINHTKTSVGEAKLKLKSNCLDPLMRRDDTQKTDFKSKVIQLLTASRAIDKVDVLVEKAFNDALAAQEWTMIHTQIQIPGENANFDNFLIPVRDVVKQAETEIPTGYFDYGSGINNIGSRKNLSQTEHVGNAWVTELKNDKGEVLFQGERHAVLAVNPHKIPDKTIRLEASTNKAKELIHSALMLKIEDLQAIAKTQKAKQISANEISEEANQSTTSVINSDESLNLRLTSTSLMTMYDMNILKFHELEKSMSEDQTAGLNAAAAEMKAITVDGVSIPVSVDICHFNDPVNIFSKIGYLGIKQADKINKKALVTLIGSLKPDKDTHAISGWAGEKIKALAKLNTPESKKNIFIITTLAEEIRNIINQNTYHGNTEDLFGLSRRVIFLSHLVGAVPLFNCKSGKDRTSMADTEVKLLAAHLDKLSVDDLNTNVDLSYLIAFYFDQANAGLQAFNSGVPGNKCMNYNYDNFNKKLGGHENVRKLTGLTANVK